MLKKIENFITKIEPPNWVLAVMAVITILRIPSFFEPYYYFDEMIYLALGNGIRRGLILYSQVFDHKPPMIYLTGAVAGSLFWFKTILMFWMLITTGIFWHLTKDLFGENKKAQKVAVIIFAIFTTIPMFEGNIVNAELFLIGPIILGTLLLLKKPTYKNTFISGIIFSIAFLFKVPAAFDATIVLIFWLITIKTKKDFVNLIKKTLVLALGFIIPVLITLIYFYFKGALVDYIQAALLENLGYIASWTGAQNQSFVVKNGPILIRAGIVAFGIILLRLKSHKLSKSFLITTIWLLTSLFAVTLSGRPYPHYLIQAIPPISLLVAILVSSEKFEQVLAIIPLTLAILVPVYYKFYYYSTSSYYVRFINYAVGKTTKWEYFNTFDKYTQANYAVSEFLMKSTDPTKRIFVWGDSAPVIYALSRQLPIVKYESAYHIDLFGSRGTVLNQIKNNPPQFIVIPPTAPKFPELQAFASKNYILIYNNYNFAVWQLLGN